MNSALASPVFHNHSSTQCQQACTMGKIDRSARNVRHVPPVTKRRKERGEPSADGWHTVRQVVMRASVASCSGPLLRTRTK
jgi:hypothetical protein